MGHASGKSLSISLYCMVLVGIALYHCWLWWMGCISQDTYLLIAWYCMVLHGIELQHTEFHVISLYSIVLHGIAWFCFVLHGIVSLTMCSVTYSWYVKLWGLPRRVFTRLQRWSFFSNDVMVMFFLQGTIANDGFSMVLLPPDHHHWMFFCRLTIDIDGFSMVLPKFRYDG